MNDSNLEKILSQLQLPSGAFPSLITNDELEECLHNMRAAAISFVLLVDSLEVDLKKSGSERDHRKYLQLKTHAEQNKQTVEMVIAAIKNSISRSGES